MGAKVNSKMVPLKYTPKSGDSVEILTSKTQTPSKDWLKIAKTGRAQSRIKQWLHKVERKKHRELGQEVFEKSLKVFSTSVKNLVKNGSKAKSSKMDQKCSQEEQKLEADRARWSKTAPDSAASYLRGECRHLQLI